MGFLLLTCPPEKTLRRGKKENVCEEMRKRIGEDEEVFDHMCVRVSAGRDIT